MELVKLIDRELSLLMPVKTAEPRKLHEAMRYGVFPGGKRIRPVILIETALACGGRIKDALPAAAAVEMVHAYSLIHDDLPSMDDDDMRRGRPSCHKAFGQAVAILAGDALLTLAFGVIAARYPSAAGAKMAAVLSDAIGSRGMAGGQALDILGGGRRHSPKERGNINRLKTARLFEASALLGAVCAGAPDAMAGAAARYGALLGEAFQAADDAADGEDIVSLRCREALIKKASLSLKIFGKKGANLKNIAGKVLAPEI